MLPSAFVMTIVGRQAVVQLVEALHYKPEGRRFDLQWSHWDLSLI
jgi:hypothetical protein